MPWTGPERVNDFVLVASSLDSVPNVHPIGLSALISFGVPKDKRKVQREDLPNNFTHTHADIANQKTRLKLHTCMACRQASHYNHGEANSTTHRVNTPMVRYQRHSHHIVKPAHTYHVFRFQL